MAIKQEFTYHSRDKRSNVHAIEWRPEKKEIKGVLQIAHGMMEYIDRYDEFARFLTGKGFVVVGNDHLGHGATAATKEDFGYFHETDGNKMLLADIHQLRRLTQKKYPSVPYFVLGHSMGSFLIRQYICRCGEGLAGVIIMGTGSQSALTLISGKLICKGLSLLYGDHHRSKFVHKMVFGGFKKAFRSNEISESWLTKDNEVVQDYKANEWCTFHFTVNGYYNLFYSMEEAQEEKNLRRMPKDLPVLLVSGAEDPVGNHGKGVEQVRSRFESAGMEDVVQILYKGDRHEILNETDREKIYRDIGSWMTSRLQKI